MESKIEQQVKVSAAFNSETITEDYIKIEVNDDNNMNNNSLKRKINDEATYQVENAPKKSRTSAHSTTTNSISQQIKTNNKYSTKYKYGNYDRYYGYRNTKDFTDVRLDAFQNHRNLFDGKDLLDIGCNNGLVTTSIAQQFNINFITGIDIDRRLIGRALHGVNTDKRKLISKEADSLVCYPHNILFKHCDYVLSDAALLDLEKPQFDTILCLSVTKWIHLNNGDRGLKLAFRRMFRQLRPGGHLILEAQNWQSYKRRKKLTPEISENFKCITLLPNQFDEYLTGADVGFSRWYLLDVPGNPSKGFQRPIKVFVKPCG